MKECCFIVRMEDTQGRALVTTYALKDCEGTTKVKDLTDAVAKLKGVAKQSTISAKFGFLPQGLVNRQYFELKGEVVHA